MLKVHCEERMKAGNLARCIRDRERGGRIPIVTIDAGTEAQYPQCQEMLQSCKQEAPNSTRNF